MRRILGIDPGTRFMGYGIIDCNGSKLNCVAIGVLDLTAYEDAYVKLKKIYEKVESLIKSFTPDELAIEAQFYSNNAQSMLKLGRAQGVAILSASNNGMQVCEYEPRKIKLAVTGNGAASKEQVSNMVIKMLNLSEVPDKFDATDALATAICHNFNVLNPTIAKNSKSNSSWKNFINQNPSRVKH